MSEQEVTYIISGKVGRVGKGSVARGSSTEVCSMCQAPVWCSPSSSKIKQELGEAVQFLCIDCSRPRIEEAGEDAKMCPANTTQIKEVADALGISMLEATQRIKEVQDNYKELIKLYGEN